MTALNDYLRKLKNEINRRCKVIEVGHAAYFYRCTDGSKHRYTLCADFFSDGENECITIVLNREVVIGELQAPVSHKMIVVKDVKLNIENLSWDLRTDALHFVLAMQPTINCLDRLLIDGERLDESCGDKLVVRDWPMLKIDKSAPSAYEYMKKVMAKVSKICGYIPVLNGIFMFDRTMMNVVTHRGTYSRQVCLIGELKETDDGIRLNIVADYVPAVGVNVCGPPRKTAVPIEPGKLTWNVDTDAHLVMVKLSSLFHAFKSCRAFDHITLSVYAPTSLP